MRFLVFHRQTPEKNAAPRGKAGGNVAEEVGLWHKIEAMMRVLTLPRAPTMNRYVLLDLHEVQTRLVVEQSP